MHSYTHTYIFVFVALVMFVTSDLGKENSANNLDTTLFALVAQIATSGSLHEMGKYERVSAGTVSILHRIILR